MISRLTAVSTAFAVITAVLFAIASTPRTSTTVAVASPTIAKKVPSVELTPVVVTGKRSQATDPI